MTPELIQWLLYAGLMIGGWLLRHYGVSLPGLPAVPAPTAPLLPALSHMPRLQAVLAKLGPQAESWLLELVQGELQKMASPAPAQQAPGK